MSTILEVRNVSKRYRETKALDNVSFKISSGKICGFVGPNGAGKTTMIKIICGLLYPDNGEVFCLGGNNNTRAFRKNIGYLSEGMGYYEGFTVYQYLRYFYTLYRLPISSVDSRIKEILELMNLSERVNTKISTLSHGMKQKLGIARALFHDPSLLIFDEPLSGLDPSFRREFIELLRYINTEDGKTIFVSSHELKDIDEICNDVIIINKGKIVTFGSIKELMKNIYINFDIPIKQYNPIVEELPYVFPEIRDFKIQNDTLKFKAKQREGLEKDIFRWLIEKEIGFSIGTHRLSSIYENIFENKTGE